MVKLSDTKRTVLISELLALLILVVILTIIVTRSILSKENVIDNDKQTTIKRFNQIYYDSRVWQRTSYLGIPTQQFPCDLWVIQEIIADLKPDFIIETGTYNGGSTLFFADTLEKVNANGRIISVDIDPQIEKAAAFDSFKKRVEVIQGDSASPEVLEKISQRIGGSKTLVTLDSLHTKEHVLKELKAYSRFVSLGSYMIVQDTNINGHPAYPTFGPGPMEAAIEFLKDNSDFEIDHGKEKFLLTAYPSGYLKRVR